MNKEKLEPIYVTEEMKQILTLSKGKLSMYAFLEDILNSSEKYLKCKEIFNKLTELQNGN